MVIVSRWLKVLVTFMVLIGALVYWETSPVLGQRPMDPPSNGRCGAFRHFLPPRPNIQALQNNGKQFGFNGITGSTNIGNAFAGSNNGNNHGFAGGQFGQLGQFGLSGQFGQLGQLRQFGQVMGGTFTGNLSGNFSGAVGGIMGVAGNGGLGSGKLGMVGNGLYGQ